MEVTEGASKVEPGLGLILKVTERTPVIIVNSSNQRRIVGYEGDPNDLFA
jgi:cell division septal protein FtsQ